MKDYLPSLDGVGMAYISNKDLGKIIALGRVHGQGEDHAAMLIDEMGKTMSHVTLPLQDWVIYVVKLSDQDLLALIRGIVLLHHSSKFKGGSTACEIWIYREIQKRDLDPQFELADWIRTMSFNPYVPFGTHNRPRSKVEYEKLYKQIFERDFYSSRP
ncbi:MAG: hypothetical protein JW883_00865 [Deltaproteobacteria bacterium]|nr:hypothetical protein [Deltaproteobacteria bacterium]